MNFVRYATPLAVEHLVFQVNPERLEEWLALDHEIWTLGEAERWPGLVRKEVWLNANVPGEVHCVIYWSDYDLWMSIDPAWLAWNETRFADRFGAEDVRFVRADHEEGIQCYKISEFNNTAP
jgi:uncharacterized protein (TIGR03792 family)